MGTTEQLVCPQSRPFLIVVASSRHSTPSIKVRVPSRRIWRRRAIMAVRHFLRPTTLVSSPLVAFTLSPIVGDQEYRGPHGGSDNRNLCLCNTLIYSLISACGGCQGGTWQPYVSLNPSPEFMFANLLSGGMHIPSTARRLWPPQRKPIITRLLFLYFDGEFFTQFSSPRSQRNPCTQMGSPRCHC
jgi:hypothetical protein